MKSYALRTIIVRQFKTNQSRHRRDFFILEGPAEARFW